MKPDSVLAVAAALLVLTGCAAASPGDTTSASPSAASSPAATVAPSSASPSAGPSTSPSPTRSATPTPPPTEPAADVTVAVTVKGGKVSPNAENVRMKRGQTVRFALTTDVAESIHIHGYDKTLEAKPGRTATLDLVADQSGVFEVETHETPKLVVKLIVA